MTDTRVSIIVPTLNEAPNLSHVLPHIPRVPEIAEVILVDGHSMDGTVEVAKGLMPEIIVVQQDGRGKGNAVKCGAQAASYDYFIVLDADGSHDPTEIPLYLEKAKEGYDLVKGSRYMEGASTADETFDRGFLVRLSDFVANTLWRTHFEDMAYGLYLIDRQKFLDLDIRADHFEIEWEILVKAHRRGLKIARVPANEAIRGYGDSHLTYRRDGRLIFKVVMLEALHGLFRRGSPEIAEKPRRDSSG